MWVTLRDAEILAKQIKENSPLVLCVDLVGSVARNGKGHDVDLVCTVDEETTRKWWSDPYGTRVKGSSQILFFRQKILKRFAPWLDEAFVHHQKAHRQKRTSNLLGIDLSLLGKNHRSGIFLDVWLFPTDWRTGNTLNHSVLTGISDIAKEPNTFRFLQSFAKDAKRIA